MSVTQKDIARHVGVSPQAVAHALSGIGRLRPETRERILQAAKELGYRTNPMARALVTGKTNLIALWMQRNLSPFYARMAFTLGQLVADANYDLVMTNLASRIPMPLLEKNSEITVDEFAGAAWPADGIFSLGDSRLAQATMEKRRTQSPIVCLGSDYECQTQTLDKVVVDLYPAAVAAMQHLVARRKRVAFVAAWTLIFEHQPRYKAYCEIMRAAGRPLEIIEVPHAQDMRANTFNHLKGYAAVHGTPDALFCGSDGYSMGALRALHELGRRVPEDVALVGCDGLPETVYSVPSLSTIEQPLEEMCGIAWQFLRNRIENPDLPRQQAVLEAVFRARESSQ